MKKLISSSLITLGLIAGMAFAVQAAESATEQKLVEVRLVDTIDEDRGYCLDIAGGKGANAPLDRGMQAHTCYDYTRGLLEDQSFDEADQSMSNLKNHSPQTGRSSVNTSLVRT